jgi:hypothetical protein
MSEVNAASSDDDVRVSGEARDSIDESVPCSFGRRNRLVGGEHSETAILEQFRRSSNDTTESSNEHGSPVCLSTCSTLSELSAAN